MSAPSIDIDQVADWDVLNYYDILGVSKDFTDSQTRRAYLKAARKYHPDTAQTEEERQSRETKMTYINQAYEVLATAEGRAAYSRVLENPTELKMTSEFARQMFLNSETQVSYAKSKIDLSSSTYDTFKKSPDFQTIFENFISGASFTPFNFSYSNIKVADRCFDGEYGFIKLTIEASFVYKCTVTNKKTGGRTTSEHEVADTFTISFLPISKMTGQQLFDIFPDLSKDKNIPIPHHIPQGISDASAFTNIIDLYKEVERIPKEYRWYNVHTVRQAIADMKLEGKNNKRMKPMTYSLDVDTATTTDSFRDAEDQRILQSAAANYSDQDLLNNRRIATKMASIFVKRSRSRKKEAKRMAIAEHIERIKTTESVSNVANPQMSRSQSEVFLSSSDNESDQHHTRSGGRHHRLLQEKFYDVTIAEEEEKRDFKAKDSTFVIVPFTLIPYQWHSKWYALCLNRATGQVCGTSPSSDTKSSMALGGIFIGGLLLVVPTLVISSLVSLTKGLIFGSDRASSRRGSPVGSGSSTPEPGSSGSTSHRRKAKSVSISKDTTGNTAKEADGAQMHTRLRSDTLPNIHRYNSTSSISDTKYDHVSSPLK